MRELGGWLWVKHFLLVVYVMAMVLIPVGLCTWGSDTNRLWPIVLGLVLFALMFATGTWVATRD